MLPIKRTRLPAAAALGLNPLALAIALSLATPALADGIQQFPNLVGWSNDPLLSADGSTVSGTAYNNDTEKEFAFRWTQAGGLQDFTAPSGNRLYVNAINADGSAAVGYSQDTNAHKYHAFRWTQGGGTQFLGSLGGSFSSAHAISADGSAVVGESNANDDERFAFRWTETHGMQNLGTLGGSFSSAHAISANGSAVIGHSTIDDANYGYHAFHWTETSGMQDLGTLEGHRYSFASAISANGSVVAGTSFDWSNLAFRWTETSGIQGLGTLGGPDSYANALSADGSVVVGVSTTSSSESHAFRWTETLGMQDLGTLGGDSSEAYAISADGGVVVGITDDANHKRRAFRWSAASAMQSIEDWLTSNGVAVDANAAKTSLATGVSADGNVVVGRLDNGQAFLARLNGLISIVDYQQSLAQASAMTPALAASASDMVLHGAHGSPMRSLVGEGRTSVWVGGDYGRQDSAGRDARLGSGEIGVAKNFGQGVQLNLALGRSDNSAAGDFGGASQLRSTYVLPQLIVQLPNTTLYTSFSALYGDGKADIDRGYLNAGREVQSHGSTDVQTLGARLRLDWLDAYTLGQAAFTPYTSISYLQSKLDAYSETSGSFPATWNSRTERSTTGRVGLDTVYSLTPQVRLLARLEGVHRFEDRSASAQGEIHGLSSFDLNGQEVEQNWLRAAVGAESQLGQGIGSLMVNGTSEGSDPDYWVAASYKWLF
ncbi:autotransporter domain-containing protein [Pseudomonas sp. LPB0260]|uniref:autotransporter domain-containing protein n=1 Tax=Pseudomonas sp. LPB0260 TaxID=2614442 RepID=UPI0015C1E327|nr:autotransporter domain-containing protein [Pseudomonas sp. LPB0260]QLC74620.1 autotransporter domain-containing protein [Pseudomonas sp. LPB0260]QLC77388.1 autotransporter domain-containing protein [Pseudomonas sp. LPB0260]